MNNIQKIKEKTQELLKYAHAYYDLDAPIISDTQYDKLYDELKKMEEEANFWLANSPTRKVQGETLDCLKKVKHTVPMLSADKSTNIEDVKSFIGGRKVMVSYKLDGATMVAKYNNGTLIQALTRGSGVEGEDITHTAKTIKNLPLTIPYKDYLEIRGEALIPWDKYNELNKEGNLGHPRNVSSGGLRQLSASEAAKRSIYFYAFTVVNWRDILVDTKEDSLDFLCANGFDVVPHITIPDQSGLQEALNKLNRKDYNLPTDGWCVEFSDLKYGDSLGSTAHHDRRLFALKPEIEEHLTKFRGIEYNTCRTGIVSLTAIFDTVEIGNTQVSRATLHNVDFFNSLELGLDDEISVTKFNEIIPGVVDNLTRSNTYKLIDRCPSCGCPLEIKNTGNANVLYCSNRDCSAKILSKFEHFVSKPCVNIVGFSGSTLEKLLSMELIQKFSDIYHLSRYKDIIVSMDGFGEKSYNKLIESIEKSKNIKFENFLAALGIPLIGKTASQTIAKKLPNGTWEDFMALFANNFDFTSLNDFGETMNESLWNWYNFKLEYDYSLIENIDAEFNFIREESPMIKEDEFFKDKIFCVTGSFNTMKRSDIEAVIVSRGGKLSGSVSKKTNVLLTNDADSGSSKAVKAKELGIPIMSEEEFIKKIGG